MRGPDRLRAFRIGYQIFFLAIFLATLLLMTDEGVRRFPVRWLLELDPLAALGTLASSWLLPVGLLWSLGVVALTILFGRAFCGWLCPLGTLHHVVSFLTRRLRPGPPAVVNRWRPHYQLKYLLLLAVLFAAMAGSLQAGLLDPLALAARSFASALFPAIQQALGGSGFRVRFAHAAWLTGAIFLGLLIVNRWIVRWWCRALCPLGALLGWVARAAVWRIAVDPDRCTHCNRCATDCQGADEPFAAHRVSECHVCLNCVGACPEGAITFRAFAPAAAPAGGVDLSRRHVLGAAVAGAVVLPLARASAGSAGSPGPLAMRPPGARAEAEFLARCIRCGACSNACPTSAIQPAMLEAGIEALWTPLFAPRRGWCEPSCKLCGQVCPTGAIRRFTVEEKGWTRPTPEPIRIGTAFFDQGRCLPWGMARPCIVCQEVCPTSPKAILLEAVTVAGRDGLPVRLQRPILDPERCVGCGLCEAKCPVSDLAAVRVTRIGESRSRGASFILGRAGGTS